MYTREEVLEIVDSCFHCYASDYRNDAEEYANELMDEKSAKNLSLSDVSKGVSIEREDTLVAFMLWYKNFVPIGTQKSSAEIVKDFLEATNGC